MEIFRNNMKKKIFFIFIVLLVALSSCSSDDTEPLSAEEKAAADEIMKALSTAFSSVSTESEFSIGQISPKIAIGQNIQIKPAITYASYCPDTPKETLVGDLTDYNGNTIEIDATFTANSCDYSELSMISYDFSFSMENMSSNGYIFSGTASMSGTMNMDPDTFALMSMTLNYSGDFDVTGVYSGSLSFSINYIVDSQYNITISGTVNGKSYSYSD